MLESRRIVLGVTGSIAAYKAVELASRLTQAGARVVATGGLAHVIARHTSMVDTVNLDLTLLGLRFLYDLNRP